MVTPRDYAMALLIVLVLAAVAQAQTFTTLYSFGGGPAGGHPWAGVIQDLAGNLYGTTTSGGDVTCGAGSGCGVVYKRNTDGTETVLHSFSGTSDGAIPYEPLARDKAGNIYGTTAYGGSANQGAVFKIDIAGKETVLYSFTGGSDGCTPYQGLIADDAGNLYGTAGGCGSSGGGTIFKIDRGGNFTLLHSLTGGPNDGSFPSCGHLTMDKFGNLYGVTLEGGSDNYGVLYKLSKGGTFTVLHRFVGGTLDGCAPLGSVEEDKLGNLYGVAYGCGSMSAGTMWKVSKHGEETTLHNFAGGTSDGCDPSGVTRDSKGNLYGVTYECGASNYGTLYKLPAAGRFTLLHSFGSLDGATPVGEVLRTAKGTLFGASYVDGPHGYGTVWSYVP